MGRLLDENNVIDALEKVASFFPYKIPGKGETYDKYNEAWNDAIGRAEIEIKKLPSAQPELIMCKDCKFADGEATTSNGMYWCIVHGTYMRYCSDAKRRTDVDMRGEQDGKTN